MLKKQWLITLSVLTGILLLTFFIHRPAFDSPFYLDDYLNLTQLQDIDSDGYLNFVFGGIGFPGRPVSLFTFALQHESWPDDPYSFKFINLLIHLLNGVLIFIISSLLARKLFGNHQEASIASLLIAGIWIIHPLHLTTTLYVIQRMTLLSAMFTLLGIVGYLVGREYYKKTLSPYALFLMAVAVMSCMVLSILCKENGILLAIYILVIEWTLFSHEKKTRELRFFLWLFAGIPLTMLGIYLCNKLDIILTGYLSRDYTMLERLMTEARILFIYVSKILFPKTGAYSLFYDNIEISRSLVTPVTTLFSVTGIFFSVIAGFILRAKYRVISFTILWFLGGHLLESTFIDLELYFEHRNYLPSFGLVFGVGCLAIYCWKLIRNRLMAMLIISLPFIAIFTVTVLEVQVWQNPLLQAHDLVRRHPESMRAIDHLGHIYLKERNWDKAIKTYEYHAEVFPNDIYPHLRILHVNTCVKSTPYNENDWKKLFSLAEKSDKYGFTVLVELDGIVNDLHRDICKALNPRNFAYLILVLMQNPEFINFRGLFHEYLASISLKMGDFSTAVLNINEAVRISPTPSRYIYKIKLLLVMKDYFNASQSIDEFGQYLRANPKDYLAYYSKYEQLKNILSSSYL